MPEDGIDLRQYLEQQLSAVTAHLEADALASRERSDDRHRQLLQAMEVSRSTAQELARVHEAAHNREHILADQALVKAYETMNKRLEAMNEFRDQLRDQAATFVRRDVMDAEVKSVSSRLEGIAKANSDRISALERKEANLTGRLTAFGLGISFIVVVVNIAIRFM